jgi:hypothetical protein
MDIRVCDPYTQEPCIPARRIEEPIHEGGPLHPPVPFAGSRHVTAHERSLTQVPLGTIGACRRVLALVVLTAVRYPPSTPLRRSSAEFPKTLLESPSGPQRNRGDRPQICSAAVLSSGS